MSGSGKSRCILPESPNEATEQRDKMTQIERVPALAVDQTKGQCCRMSLRADVVRALRFASCLSLLSISCSGDPPQAAPVDSGSWDVDLATCVADGPLG